MISKSDLFILVIASAALGVGILRWHQNTQDVSASTVPASTRIVTEPLEPVEVPVVVNGTVTTASNTVGQNLPSDAKPVTVQTLNKPIVQEIQAEPLVQSNDVQSGNQSTGIHRVEPGDYLGKIANRYNTDVQTLRRINGIDGNIILVGQEILYPQ